MHQSCVVFFETEVLRPERYGFALNADAIALPGVLQQLAEQLRLTVLRALPQEPGQYCPVGAMSSARGTQGTEEVHPQRLNALPLLRRQQRCGLQKTLGRSHWPDSMGTGRPWPGFEDIKNRSSDYIHLELLGRQQLNSGERLITTGVHHAGRVHHDCPRGRAGVAPENITRYEKVKLVWVAQQECMHGTYGTYGTYGTNTLHLAFDFLKFPFIVCCWWHYGGSTITKGATMARTKKTFGNLRPSDLIAIASLVKIIPLSAIKAAMAAHSKETIRKRKLSVEFLIYYVIFLSIYSSHSTSEVLKYVLNGMADVLPDDAPGAACESAISQGRTRLGEDVMRSLFKTICRPLADAQSAKSWGFYKGHRLLGIDGSDIDLPDEEAIRREYPIANDGGKNQHPCPKLRFCSTMEIGTRCIIDVEIAATRDKNGEKKQLCSKDDAETTLADPMLDRLEPGSLIIGDRLYPYYRYTSKIVRRRSNFLLRAKDSMKLTPIKFLEDGSYLANLKSRPDKHQGGAEMTIRVIDYCIYNNDREIIASGRLVTSFLDAVLYPASELAKLYHERWEIEIGYDELKTHIMGGAMAGLRSKTPELARQEFWGWLLAHYVVRKIIYEAAEMSGRDPDNISFTGTVEIIRRHVGAAIFPPKEKC